MEKIQQVLVEKAATLGIAWEALTAYGSDQLLLSYEGREVLFGVDAVPLHELNLQAYHTARNKQYSKRLFAQLGIPHPQSMVFQDPIAQQAQLQAHLDGATPFVCKPLDGMEGKGVRLHCRTLADVAAAVQDSQTRYGARDFMLEEQVSGADLRLQAVGGRLVAACRREPATVRGDGRSTLRALLQARQAVIHGQNPSNKLEVDAPMERLLQHQGLGWDSVPAEGQAVQLKELANMNQGATAYDITDTIHPTYARWIEQLAQALRQRVFALDVLTTDYRAEPTADNAWALELNGESYWLHHTFSEGRTHDIATLILKDTFDMA